MFVKLRSTSFGRDDVVFPYRQMVPFCGRMGEHLNIQLPASRSLLRKKDLLILALT